MKYLKEGLVTVVLAAMLLIGGCAEQPEQASVKPVAQTATTQQAVQEVSLYIPSENGNGVVAKKATVKAGTEVYQNALNEMFALESKQAYPIFPKGVRAEKVTVDKQIATVHMSRAFLQNAARDGLSAQLQLAAIVNTLTGFKEITGVRFVVDGKPVQTYGNFDLTSPLSRMEQAVVK